MGKLPHVGIVGAGLSGLRCADILIQKGIQVTVLEARDRVGGRVTQSDIDGTPVDMGPNWIHGTKNNPMVEISRLSNTVTHSWNGSHSIIDKFGKPLDGPMSTKVINFMWMTIDEAYGYSKMNTATIPPARSLFDYFREKLDKSGFSQLEKEVTLEVSKMWGAYIGSPIDRQSLKFFFLEECLEGVTHFVASTYKYILEHISKPVLDGATVHLNEPVVSVEAARRTLGAEHTVKVTTAIGKQYIFDELVTTFPLGWLKRNKSAFIPPLPNRLSEAIDNISYGQLEKVYIRFPVAFWHGTPPSDKTANQPNSDQHEKDADSDVPTSALTQFLSPTYITHPPSPFWNQESISLAALPKSCAHPTLLFYIYGPCASQLVSQISPLSTESPEYARALNTFLHPYYSRLPFYDADSPSCKPTAFVATKWQTDPWAGYGSYSNFQVGLEEGDRDIEVMRDGMGAERGVWFAGEHTAPFVGLGTTSGAYESGEKIAEKVCDVLAKREGGS